MKIYILHEHQYDIEDSYDRTYGVYISYDHAKEIMKQLEEKEATRKEQADKCTNCPIKNYLFSSGDMKRKAEEYCDNAKLMYVEEDDYLSCDNEDDNWIWCSYSIETVDVDETVI